MIQRALIISCLAVFLFALAQAGYRLFSHFPLSYTWTELLINYQGGFVRRGLLGELAFQLNPFIAAPYFLTAVVLASYVIVTVWMVITVFSRVDISVAILFLFCPATILFPIYDSLWDIEACPCDAFGRKDIFVLAAFALALSLIRHVRSHLVAAVGTFAVYIIAGLIAEASWFYLPLCLAAFSIIRLNDAAIARRLGLWLAAALLAIAAFLSMEWTNVWPASAQKAAIVASWLATYPNAYDYNTKPGALSFIGMPLRASWDMVIYHQSHMLTLSGYVIGFVLANVPLALLANRKMRRAPLCELEILAATGAMLLTFAVAADWGRYVYLFTCHLFMFVILTTESVPLKSVTRTITWQTVGRCCLGILFLTAWQLNHFAVGGTNPLRPGLLFMPEPTTGTHRLY